MHDMDPPLLVRAWMMAHLYGAKYQAIVCCGGSNGEAAFRESLRPRYTSERHDAKGLRTYYITGTCDETAVSRITSGCIGSNICGANGKPLRIAVASNTCLWQKGDLENISLVSLDLEMDRLVGISDNFLALCAGLTSVNLAPLHAITDPS